MENMGELAKHLPSPPPLKERVGKLRSACNFVRHNIPQLIVGLIFTIIWIQMHPTFFGLKLALELEPLSPDGEFPMNYGNGTVVAAVADEGLLNGSFTYGNGFFLLFMGLCYVSPTTFVTFCFSTSVLMLVFVFLQGSAMYMYNTLVVVPFDSWFPIVYVRVNLFQLLAMYFIFGPGIIRMIYSIISDAIHTTPKHRKLPNDSGTVSSITIRKGDVCCIRKYKVESDDLLWKDSKDEVAHPPSFPTRIGNPLRIDSPQENGTRFILGKKYKGVADFDCIPNSFKIKPISEDSVKTVKSEFGTKTFLGFPKYPPIIKPDGSPNTNPSLASNKN